jgi:hypothetical protein
MDLAPRRIRRGAPELATPLCVEALAPPRAGGVTPGRTRRGLSRNLPPAGPRRGPLPAGEVTRAVRRHGLSQLRQSQGKRYRTHELLAPIYGWFTQGSDTADLQEAKALLEELS